MNVGVGWFGYYTEEQTADKRFKITKHMPTINNKQRICASDNELVKSATIECLISSQWLKSLNYFQQIVYHYAHLAEATTIDADTLVTFTIISVEWEGSASVWATGRKSFASNNIVPPSLLAWTNGIRTLNDDDYQYI